MRISTSMMHNNMSTSISRSMGMTVEAQKDMYYKVHKAGDDPAAQSQIMLLQSTIQTNDVYSDSAKHAATIIRETESYLEGYEEATADYLSLAEKAINGSYNSEDRKVMAKQVDEIIDQMALLANSRSYNGDFMFGGNSTQSAPYEFEYNGDNEITGYKYKGNDIQQGVVVGKGIEAKSTYDGESVFTNEDGKSVFDALIELRDKLESGAAFTPDEATDFKALARSYNDHAIVRQTEVAVTADRIDTLKARYESLDLNYRSQLSALQDSDFAQVTVDIARFKNMTTSAIASMNSVLEMSEKVIGM